MEFITNNNFSILGGLKNGLYQEVSEAIESHSTALTFSYQLWVLLPKLSDAQNPAFRKHFLSPSEQGILIQLKATDKRIEGFGFQELEAS